MECVYIFNNKGYSYQELIETLANSNDLHSVLSLLYSLDDVDKQNITFDRLKELKKEFRLTSSKLPSDNLSTFSMDESDIEVGSNYYTTQTFIDSGQFMLDGDVPGFRLNFDDYLNVEKKKMTKSGMSEEEADARGQLIKSKWNKLAKDGTDLHRIVVSSTKNDDFRHFSGASLNTAYQGIYDRLPAVVEQVEREVLYRNKGAKIVRNLNLDAKLRGIAEKIVGHIDYLVIRPDGELDLYNLKVSKDAEVEWSEAKKDKYKYQLAFLKRILEHNGINIKNIRVNIVPIKLDYDDTFDNVTDITVQKAVSYDTKGQVYTMQKYDNVVAQYIDSTVDTSEINDELLDGVDKQLDKIFMGRNMDITTAGIKESAKGWVKKHWHSIAEQAVDKPGWNIMLPGMSEAIYVANTKIGANNDDVVAMVQEREEELFSNKAQYKGVSRVISDIKKSYADHRNFFSAQNHDEVNAILGEQLKKYFTEVKGTDDKGNVTEYNWKLVDNQTLANSNILLFQHAITGQLDVVALTPFDVQVKVKAKGRDNLLGWYLADMNSENFTMESNYGNIEAIKTMTLLNAVVPKLENVKLGQLKIVTMSPYHVKKGREMAISQLMPQFNTIIKVVKTNNQELSFENNFRKHGISSVDPAQVLIQSWREALQSQPGATRELKGLSKYIDDHLDLNGLTIDGLENIKTVEGKIEKLNQIVDFIKKLDPVVADADPEKLIKSYCNDDNMQRRITARIYAGALRAIGMYNGDLSIDNENFDSIDEYLFKPQIIPNTNVRTVGYMFQRSIDTISKQMMEKYSPVRTRIMKYFEDIGYGAIQNSTIGNHAAQFKNLYETDLQGNLTMSFKNPYNPSSDLTPVERDFLKDMLFEINKVRYDMRGMTMEYSGPNDPELINKINSGSFRYDGGLKYTDVPLMRMSQSTRNENVGANIKEFGRRMMKTILHPKDSFKEFAENMLGEEDNARRENDMTRLQAYNPFLCSEMSSSVRANYMNDHGADYFEYDLETILVNFMEKDIQCKEFNKMLTRTKGILLDLQLRGIAEDDPKSVEHTVKTINDYLSVSVYNKSIMEPRSQAIEAFLDPIRKGVSKCYIAANPTAFVRDITEGLLQNMTKAITKFQTDIDASDVAHGYKEVVTEGPGNLMKITKLNQLNLKYRFSNLDIARISEGMKTSGSGVLNAENWAYQTLRTPDYLNRMVLFSAKMHHDGTEDAYYIKEGELVYDWTKDRRFDIYRAGQSGNEEYGKQRSLYLSLLRIFNQENGTALKEGDALPDAYTAQQIAQFKNFADNIYGSYNQSTRAKYENVALGRNFGVFSTWMNGIVDVYAKKRQISSSESEWQQETDANGNKLWFDKNGIIGPRKLDENGEPILSVGDVPVMKDVPIMVQGVLYTIKDFFTEWYNNGWDAVKKDVWGNEVNRRNLRRLLSDLLVWMTIGAAFACVIDPAYADHKKYARGQDIVQNGLIELTYNATHNAYDGFKGPFAVLDYIGNSTNPATYKLPTKILNDLGSFIMGDKTFGGLIMGSQALPRSFRDTYRMWVRDTQGLK